MIERSTSISFLVGCTIVIGLYGWAGFAEYTKEAPAASRPVDASDPPVVVWDFRHGPTLDAVEWPPGFAGRDLGYNGTFLWRDDSPANIRIIGPDGTEGHYPVEGRQLRRVGDRIVSAGVSLPGMTYEEVSETFVAMAAVWKIEDLMEFRLWQKRWGPSGRGTGESVCFAMKRGNPLIGLTIRTHYSGRKGRLWYIQFGLQEFTPRTPATHPATTER